MTDNPTKKKIKTCAILSDGPSAHLYNQNGGQYDIVIGAGRTASIWACDWWAFCDWQTWQNYPPVGKSKPKLFTAQQIPVKMKVHEPELWKHFQYDLLTTFEEIEQPVMTLGLKWCCFSGCAALGLALHLKPDIIVCYGVDLAGTDDCLNKVDERNRSDHRWQFEKKIWADLLKNAVSKNILLYRAECGNGGNDVEACKDRFEAAAKLQPRAQNGPAKPEKPWART